MMKILFLCTAFNSLCQRLFLALQEHGHKITVELAISDDTMVEAVSLAKPDLILCPFLTKRVPPEIYNNVLTVIIHPGPPGDAGPSSLDLLVVGDTGELEELGEQLTALAVRALTFSSSPPLRRRSHWGATCLQAIEALDAGSVWAFDQFEFAGEVCGMTKSELYRGPVTKAALSACMAALQRIQTESTGVRPVLPHISPPRHSRQHCVGNNQPFAGGKTRDRPLLKASARDFVPIVKASEIFGSFSFLKPKISAEAIVRYINSGDSQPGVLSAILGRPLYIYDAHVQTGPLSAEVSAAKAGATLGTLLAVRDEAVLVECGAEYPIWIGHARRPKAKADPHLHPKLPTIQCLQQIDALKSKLKGVVHWPAEPHDTLSPWKKQEGTYQQIWVEAETLTDGGKIYYVYSEFYNGAFSTNQCRKLREAIDWALAQPLISALVLMGGRGYFSNGIALNVIEGADDPAYESWANINAIDDVVEAILCPQRGVLTFAALRGNAAAGGLAVASACDVVMSSEDVVLNPHYRALGLYGSEYHTFSWAHRAGLEKMQSFCRRILPMDVKEGMANGLVDYCIRNDVCRPSEVVATMKRCINRIMTATVGGTVPKSSSDRTLLNCGAKWTQDTGAINGALAEGSALSETSTLLYKRKLQNKFEYLRCLFGQRTIDAGGFQECFAHYRCKELEMMALDFWHVSGNVRYHSRRKAFVRKILPNDTPTRFALHRRYGPSWADHIDEDAGSIVFDEEEKDEFDTLGGISADGIVVPPWPPVATFQNEVTPPVNRYSGATHCICQTESLKQTTGRPLSASDGARGVSKVPSTTDTNKTRVYTQHTNGTRVCAQRKNNSQIQLMEQVSPGGVDPDESDNTANSSLCTLNEVSKEYGEKSTSLSSKDKLANNPASLIGEVGLPVSRLCIDVNDAEKKHISPIRNFFSWSRMKKASRASSTQARHMPPPGVNLEQSSLAEVYRKVGHKQRNFPHASPCYYAETGDVCIKV